VKNFGKNVFEEHAAFHAILGLKDLENDIQNFNGMLPIQNKFNNILSKKSVDLANRWISNFEKETFHEILKMI
jgi:hypothetical protein